MTPQEGSSKQLTTDHGFRLLVETVKDYALIMLDPNGIVVSWNAGAKHIKGYTAEEIIGSHFSRFYPPEDVAAGKPEKELVQAAKDGRMEDEDWRVRKDGTRFWANVVITALRDPESGELIGYGKVTRDLTERKRAEEILRQSEEQFRLLVERVEEYAIFMLDSKGAVMSWNAGAQQLKGYKAHEIIGQNFTRFYPAEDQAKGKPAALLKQARAKGHTRDQGLRVRKDGTTFQADVLITAIHDEEGNIRGYAKLTRDMTTDPDAGAGSGTDGGGKGEPGEGRFPRGAEPRTAHATLPRAGGRGIRARKCPGPLDRGNPEESGNGAPQCEAGSAIDR